MPIAAPQTAQRGRGWSSCSGIRQTGGCGGPGVAVRGPLARGAWPAREQATQRPGLDDPNTADACLRPTTDWRCRDGATVVAPAGGRASRWEREFPRSRPGTEGVRAAGVRDRAAFNTGRVVADGWLGWRRAGTPSPLASDGCELCSRRALAHL